MKRCKLTIFTPTFNRANLLKRLYDSLLMQSCKDFEWIIVDDASIDNTEEVVKRWQNNNNDFEIIYKKIEHGGKHRAINCALDIAKCDFFFIVDSDDILSNDAVEKVLDWTDEIKYNNAFCGVSGLKVLMNTNKKVGSDPAFKNREYVDASNFERQKYGLLGDKAEVYKTDILRKHRFPEFENEYFVTEDVVYQEIAHEGYKIRWYDYPIYYCEYLEDGLTKQGANDIKGHLESYLGYCYWVKRALQVKPFGEKYSVMKSFISTIIHMEGKFSHLKDIDYSCFKFILYMIFVFPISYIFSKVEKIIYSIKRCL